MEDEFNGAVHGVRFVQLHDGRRIMQYRKLDGRWYTAPSVQVDALSTDEYIELRNAIGVR